MADIVERLRENAPMGETAVIRNLMYHAADEIERLRELASYLTEERRRLRVEAGYD